MGFWVFMFVCELFMPLLMILIGRSFLKNPPKTINGIYGYRTTMSRKNQDTWDFAHKACGKLWWKIGWIMLPCSLVPMLFVIEKGEDAIGIVGGTAMTIQCIVLVGSIFPVEKELKKNFDKRGRRR